MAPKSFDAAASGASALDSEMMSEGSFQLVDHLTEITAEDYQMAEQVAETRKNEEDAASLTLSGANPDGYAILQNATKVDLQKSLAELTEAMQQLATKDKPVDQGVSTQPVAARGRGAILRSWWSSRRLLWTPTASPMAARSFLWSRASGTSPRPHFGRPSGLAVHFWQPWGPHFIRFPPDPGELCTGDQEAAAWKDPGGGARQEEGYHDNPQAWCRPGDLRVHLRAL